MPDYSKSVIYKLYDNTNGDAYYGSTCNKLRFRIKDHKTKALSKTATKICKSKSIILNDDYTYSVVEEFPCETKLELHTRERWWIENNKCVNKVIPTRTYKEYSKDNKEYLTKRDADNYIKNKEKKSIFNKKWYIDNKELIQEKAKIDRALNIVCECGLTITKGAKYNHDKTARHIKLMSCLPCPSPPQSSPP